MRSSLYGPHARLRVYTTVRQYANAFRRVLTGQFDAGDGVARMKSALAERLGASVVPMPMARTGIYLTVKALIQPGQDVILSPYTIADVVNMVVCAGGNPVFAELDPGTCNISADSVEQLIHKDTGCVLVTHFYGLICDVKRIKALCDKAGVPMVEDAAQAFGAHIDGQPAGTFGTAGIFSFGLYKNVNAFFGGAVVTRDAALQAKLEAEIQDWNVQPVGGWFAKVISGLQIDTVTHPLLFGGIFFWLFRYGFLNDVDAINNKLKIDLAPKLAVTPPPHYLHRLSATQADMVVDQLAGVDGAMQHRISMAKRYADGLQGIEGLSLPPLHEDGRHAYWYFPVQAKDRHALVAYAMKQGRDITESYHRNCADLDCFAHWKRECPVARETAGAVIYLPTYPHYPLDEVDANIRVIRAFYGMDA